MEVMLELGHNTSPAIFSIRVMEGEAAPHHGYPLRLGLSDALLATYYQLLVYLDVMNDCTALTLL